MTINLCLQKHVLGDALEILDGPSEVNTSHGFHQDIQHLTFLHGRQHDGLLIFHAVNLPDILPVHIHHGKVVTVVECQYALFRHFR